MRLDQYVTACVLGAACLLISISAHSADFVVHFVCPNTGAPLGVITDFSGPTGTLTLSESCTAGSPCAVAYWSCYDFDRAENLGDASFYVTGGPEGGGDVAEVVTELQRLADLGVAALMGFVFICAFVVGYRFANRAGDV